MKIKNLLENLEIQSLSHEGRGVAKAPDGRTVFVFNALPGERVKATVTHQKRHLMEAEATEVQNPHPHRQTPPCKVFGMCGGCELQHLAPQMQVRHKTDVLLEQLKHFGQVTPQSVLPPLIGNSEGYRHKARLSVRFVAKKESALVGFHERQGRFVVEMQSCPVLHPLMSEQIELWRVLITQLDARHEIPQLEIACADIQSESKYPIAVILRHLKPLSVRDLDALKSFAEAQSCQLYLQAKGPDALVLLYPQTPEPLVYQLPDHHIAIEFSPVDFTQVNRVLNRKMVNQALELLDLKPTDRVLDLFCGLGNFTLPIARYADFVLGIEGDLPMVKKALENARRNHLSQVEFIQADLFSETPGVLQLENYQLTKVLLDPPRAGALAMVHEIGRLKISRVVYVSCNPATLARDLGVLVNQYGYELLSVGMMDMFTHTSHIEAMALLVLPGSAH